MRGNGESEAGGRCLKSPFLRSSDYEFFRGAFYWSSVYMLAIASGDDIEPSRCALRLLAPGHLLAPALVARNAALAAGVPRLFTRPLVRRTLLMGRLAALAGDLTLLGAIHRGKSAIFLGHVVLLPYGAPPGQQLPGCSARLASATSCASI